MFTSAKQSLQVNNACRDDDDLIIGWSILSSSLLIECDLAAMEAIESLISQVESSTRNTLQFRL